MNIKKRKRKQDKKNLKVSNKESKSNVFRDDNQGDFSYEMHSNKSVLRNNFKQEVPYQEFEYQLPLYSGHANNKSASR